LDFKANHKLVRKVKDDLFDEERLDQYKLFVLAGNRDCQLAVVDAQSERFILLEDHVFPDSTEDQSSDSALRHLFDSHLLLQAGFWKEINIAVKNPFFTQISTELFDEKAARQLLSLNTPIQEADQVLWKHSPNSKVVTVFSIPNEIYSWLSGYYLKKEIRFVHQSAALIAGVESLKNQGDRIYAFIDRFRFHLIGMSGGELKYYNQFQIRQFADYTRYLLMVMKLLGFSQQNCPVTLQGFVGKDSPHFQELKRYIQTLELGTRPINTRTGQLFDEIQEHQFFDIFALAKLK